MSRVATAHGLDITQISGFGLVQPDHEPGACHSVFQARHPRRELFGFDQAVHDSIVAFRLQKCGNGLSCSARHARPPVSTRLFQSQNGKDAKKLKYKISYLQIFFVSHSKFIEKFLNQKFIPQNTKSLLKTNNYHKKSAPGSAQPRPESSPKAATSTQPHPTSDTKIIAN
jgi:hypothetical protein